ncbi:hypothetical protein [Actinokineospora pegani]|uniref:hypothetical protein n=1 Tax=Actinokineospora pegani TaxID=2654637 RepID=UPI0012EAB600|nr:hypothetical protein [Actinokineospora pegani]
MSLMDRVRGLFRRPEPEPLDVHAPGLAVVASCDDPAVAPSSVLAASKGWAEDGQAVLRYRLELPAARVGEASGLIGQDGYELRVDGEETADPVRCAALRAGIVTALAVARDHSRMASLAQRLGGDAIGWDVLQPREGETDNIGVPDLT